VTAELAAPGAKPEAPATAQKSPLQTVVELWDTIPGVDELTATTLVAEMEPTWISFPAQATRPNGRDVSWKQGKRGKRLSGKTPKGSVWLRRALCQAAWLASRTKNTYLAAQYHHLIVRKGKKRDDRGSGPHDVWSWPITWPNDSAHIRELGGDYFDRRNADTMQHRLVKKLKNLGYEVTLTPINAPPTAQEPSAQCC